MLVNLNDVLIPAKKKKYAVGLFNAVNLELARGIICAAEEKKSPVIMGTAEVLLPYGPLEEVSYYLIPMARKASVPVVIHLDHGLTRETCLEALDLGFSSIMYDCSLDSYEENVRKTKEMAQIAHSYNATIEAELGHVGDNGGSAEGGSQLQNPEDFYTDPLVAKDFVEKTGVDALAIAVGTAHGTYTLPPKLDFNRICEIEKTISIPLVLHGGSGLTDDDFKRAVSCGISKINVFTDINVRAVEAALREFSYMDKGIIDLIPAEIEAIKQEVLKKIKVFGSNGHGTDYNVSEQEIRSIVEQVLSGIKRENIK
ncbi:class II fructose-bisphosphate aldolase [Muricomes intestini]|uniref:Fructose-bisphosphate aldolase class II n=1 Tax=Muricomes intestini TaxID=1796634 RepID=A0A4R3K0T7_9FIRM|nr:class II fructose-bisphosphate aldolase [Muricomes intestini]TCS74659.1 fructose-bisphosphate aldolase class II [Muricomes intestini]HAX50531.1 ketose-bisphosphate aldolase [Lachnospiraceae bacterium]HCR83711.1 ketose-bisphosphate aldolase [Lachnospiraceae bacterium]